MGRPGNLLRWGRGSCSVIAGRGRCTHARFGSRGEALAEILDRPLDDEMQNRRGQDDENDIAFTIIIVRHISIEECR